MDWKIWWSKAWMGFITAVFVGAIGYVTATLTALRDNPDAGIYVATLAPLGLHALGLLNNYLKHSGWLPD